MTFVRTSFVRNVIQVILMKKLGEKPGLVVRTEGSRPRGRGFESCRILDGCKRCKLLHNQYSMKKGNKGSQMGHTKKKKF